MNPLRLKPANGSIRNFFDQGHGSVRNRSLHLKLIGSVHALAWTYKRPLANVRIGTSALGMSGVYVLRRVTRTVPHWVPRPTMARP